jgi:hypothetical protein
MLRASLGKVVHTVKRAGTYAAKVPPPELHKIAVHVRAVPYSEVPTPGGGGASAQIRAALLSCFGRPGLPAAGLSSGLFRLFRFYTETESFHVSIEQKQTEDQPEQFDREHILVFFSGNLEFFRFFDFLVFFGLFRNSLIQLFRFCTETENFECFD